MKQVIKQKLLELQDEEYKEFNSNLCPNTKNIIGIRIPILRNYAKELLKKYNFEELMENIDNEYYEGIMLQGMLIGLAKEDFSTILEYIKCFVPKINSTMVNTQKYKVRAGCCQIPTLVIRESLYPWTI